MTPCCSVNLLFFGQDGRILLQFRDKKAEHAPHCWSLWGGRVEDTDASLYYAAAREAEEELGLGTSPCAFDLLDEKRGGDGQLAVLLRYQSRIGWTDIAVNEGAGAGFFFPDEISAMPLAKRLRYYLEQKPDLLLPPRT